MVSGTPGTESMRKDVGAVLCTKGVTPQGRGDHRQMGRARICSDWITRVDGGRAQRDGANGSRGLISTCRGAVEKEVVMAQRRSETGEDKDIDSDPEEGLSSSMILH